LQAASKKQSVPEGQADHGNTERDLASENKDEIPKNHKGNRAPEQAEIPISVEGNADTSCLVLFLWSPSHQVQFPGAQRGTRGFLDD
jgi:hypothetical protein